MESINRFIAGQHYVSLTQLLVKRIHLFANKFINNWDERNNKVDWVCKIWAKKSAQLAIR